MINTYLENNTTVFHIPTSQRQDISPVESLVILFMANVVKGQPQVDSSCLDNNKRNIFRIRVDEVSSPLIQR